MKKKIAVEIAENGCIVCDESSIFDSFIGRACRKYNVMLAQRDGKYLPCPERKAKEVEA